MNSQKELMDQTNRINKKIELSYWKLILEEKVFDEIKSITLDSIDDIDQMITNRPDETDEITILITNGNDIVVYRNAIAVNHFLERDGIYLKER